MPIEKKLHRCEPDDPHRCQGVGKSGQCPYLAEPDNIYCLRHGGNKKAFHEKVKRANLYRLQVWQERLEEFADSDEATTLKSEIAILRVILEQILNKCNNTNELIIYSNKISEVAAKIEKLLTASHRIERNLGQLLDKSAALNFAGQVVGIISQHVSDPEVIDAISNSIIDALHSLTGAET